MKNEQPNVNEQKSEKRKFTARQFGLLLKESFRFSQGDEELQSYFLGIANNFIDLSPFEDVSFLPKVMEEFMKELAGSKSKEPLRKVQDVSYGYGLEQGVEIKGMYPEKEVKTGGHAQWIRPVEDLSTIVTSLLKPEQALQENIDMFIAHSVRKDLNYITVIPPGVWASKRGYKNGRPGNRDVLLENYDNQRKDKYFSFVVNYLIKGNKQPEDKMLDGLIGEIFKLVTESGTFKKLLSGTEDEVIWETKYNANRDVEEKTILQQKFDELILNYNTTHSTGQIDLFKWRADH